MPRSPARVDPAFAGRVLWFDALVGNVDRSWRNPNLLFWPGAPYLIDHGAALTFHHRWPARATTWGYAARELTARLAARGTRSRTSRSAGASGG